nr:HAMP domain-containing sensor histidine kinase [Sphingorhabdus profundilacus]
MENGDSLNVVLNALSLGSSIENAQIRRQIDGRLFDVWGEQLVDEQQRAVGFRLSFVSHGEETLAIAALAPVGGALFGKNLAPVLRQPLGRIIANAETIGGELQGPIRENYALYARDIANAARHLSALVDDLGDLEAVERPDFRTARDEIELGDVARRVAGLLALKAADHRIVIHTPTDASKVTAIAEFRRTLQILLNLVNNAIRYSPDGTVISIETETADRFAVVTVSDQGRGISIEDRDKIFEKFERLGRSGDGGSGLGLYISRRLARAMGGELSVTNSDDGGAKFVLRLPNS